MASDFIGHLRKAIGALGRWPHKNFEIYHHNDADGLSSGAILETALYRSGINPRRFCLERLYPQALQRVLAASNRVLFFTDFGGFVAPDLAELNQGRNLILILDHHPPRIVSDPTVFNLNPELFGLKGDRDIAAATTCLHFAQELNADNRDLSPLAVLGAVGDRFAGDGRLTGENRKALESACHLGLMRMVTKGEGQQIEIRRANNHWQSVESLVDQLDLLGGVGYYAQGPEQGVGICRTLSQTIPDDTLSDTFEDTRETLFSAERERLTTGGLNQLNHLQWFNVQDRFKPMGVKTIGAFCQRIRTQSWLHPRKYLLGFQAVPNKIPGLGEIDLDTVKVSMRVTPDLAKRITLGQATGLNCILPEAAGKVGGYADACHSLAAAVTIPTGKELALIKVIEAILDRF